MSRLPGATGGPLGGGSDINNMRLRRQSQKTSLTTGDYLGEGLRLDKQGRMAVRQIPIVNPDNPDALRLLIQYLQAAGLMER